MKKSYLIKLLIGIVAIFAIIAGCGGSSDNAAPVVPDNDDGKTKRFLFVQNASSGTFVNDGSNNYTLTLKGVSPQTIYFSDRPVRDAGQVPMQKFLDTGCFKNSNPPNAAIDVLGASEANDVVIVELLNPIYNADTATLQYTAHILKDGNLSIDSFNTRKDDSIAESFGGVALFIDDCSNFKVYCVDKDGHKAGEMTCCSCFSWSQGCNLQKDCCSFDRCQNSCTNKYGSNYDYIQVCDGVWVNNLNDWYKGQNECSWD